MTPDEIDTAEMRKHASDTYSLENLHLLYRICTKAIDDLEAARADRDQNWDLGNAMTIGLGVAAEQRDRSIARAEAAESEVRRLTAIIADWTDQ